MKEEICKNCKYWKAETDYPHDGTMGKCRINPPLVFVNKIKEKIETENTGTIEERIEIRTEFPEIGYTGFCGKFKLKE